MIDCVILAAGKGTRMRSNITKVLNPLLEKPILSYLVDSVVESALFQNIIIVVSYENKKEIADSLRGYPRNFIFVVQNPIIGTGHAVMGVLKAVPDMSPNLLVLYGDHPLLSVETLRSITTDSDTHNAIMIMVTAKVPNYDGLYSGFYHDGRISRKDGNIIGIIEFCEATAEEKTITEFNPGLYIFNTSWLRENIHKIPLNDKKKEYFLTDIVSVAVNQQNRIASSFMDARECFGVNTQEELKRIEQILSVSEQNA